MTELLLYPYALHFSLSISVSDDLRATFNSSSFLLRGLPFRSLEHFYSLFPLISWSVGWFHRFCILLGLLSVLFRQQGARPCALVDAELLMLFCPIMQSCRCYLVRLFGLVNAIQSDYAVLPMLLGPIMVSEN